jgi:hypothetical protein
MPAIACHRHLSGFAAYFAQRILTLQAVKDAALRAFGSSSDGAANNHKRQVIVAGALALGHLCQRLPGIAYTCLLRQDAFLRGTLFTVPVRTRTAAFLICSSPAAALTLLPTRVATSTPTLANAKLPLPGRTDRLDTPGWYLYRQVLALRDHVGLPLTPVRICR